MATSLEKSITNAALKALNAISGCRAKKRYSGYMGSSDLDIYGCINGRAFFLEGKRPGEKPTPRQASIMRDWASVGAITGVYSSAAEAVGLVAGAREENSHGGKL